MPDMLAAHSGIIVTISSLAAIGAGGQGAANLGAAAPTENIVALCDVDDQRAWSYTPGQRRVRLAPEFAYDTPSAQMGGTMFFDEISIFQGRMDRFAFELKGKQLMYMPYHNWRMHLVRGDPAQLLDPHHYKPEMVRHELRRVWVVEATPYPGVRHMASKMGACSDLAN